MPKVKQETKYVLGRKYAFQYHVDSHGTFTCRLPMFMREILNLKQVTGDTMAACEQALKKQIKLAQESQTQTRKVIVYEIKFSGLIPHPGADMSKFGDVDYDELIAFDSHQHDSPAEGISFAEGGGVTIYASVYTEHRTGLDGKFVYRYTEEDSTIPESLRRGNVRLGGGEGAENLIDWSPAAEKFFSDLGTRLDVLIYGLLSFLTKDNDTVAKIANDPKALKSVLQPKIGKQ